MARLKIEDVAKECGLTKRTIRYYEELGILSPPQRSEKGTRLYTKEHIDELKKIVNAREVLGFSLQELQQFISIGNSLENHSQDYKNTTDRTERRRKLAEIDRILGEQLHLVEQKIQRIQEVKAELEAKRKRAREAIVNIDKDQQK
jgi:DNA-binding transcriptional MerR regulator